MDGEDKDVKVLGREYGDNVPVAWPLVVFAWGFDQDPRTRLLCHRCKSDEQD